VGATISTPVSSGAPTVVVENDEEDESEEPTDSSFGDWWNDMKKNLESETGESAKTTEREQTENEKKENEKLIDSAPATPLASPNVKDDAQKPANGTKLGTPVQLPKLTLSDTSIQIPVEKFKEPKGVPRRSRGTVNESVKLKYNPIGTSSSKESSDNELAAPSPSASQVDLPLPTKKGVLRFDNGVYKGDIIVTPDSYSLAHGIYILLHMRNNLILRLGYGTFTSSAGEIFIGQWKMGKRDGKGVKTWEDGREYIGEWSSNRRTGNVRRASL
jgi:hypothetical protein